MIDQSILAEARRLIAAGADQEMILSFFRDRNLGKIDSINSVRVLYGTSMSEAKELVDHSNTWCDRFDIDTKLRETARRTLKDVAASNDKNLPNIEFIDSD